MIALVLAAGSGRGLEPYTTFVQKETISVVGKPVIRYVVDGLVDAGIDKFVVVVGDKEEQVKEALSGVSIPLTFVRQKRKGIEGAVLDGMSEVDDEVFTLAYGDIVAPPRFYRSLMNAYLEGGKDAVFSLVPVSEGLSTYGLAVIQEGKLKAITNTGSTLALAGAYVIPKGNFDNLLDYFNHLIQRGSNYFVWSGSWVDVGYPEDLIRAVESILSNRATEISEKAYISRTAVIGRGVIVEENAYVDEYAVIKGPAYIGRNVYVGNFSLIRDFTSLEEDSRVGAYAELAHALVQPRADVGSKAYLSFSIIGSSSKIGAGVVASSYPAEVTRSKVEKLGCLISPSRQVPHGKVLEPGYRE
ncbi:nucleotidyltransferase [Sulfodiicoccus acidiphilus]|uniref:Nucleotidyltransferase n=1 Tax=Sulfodiicoccus acidiphilus TaxID=1670455 RepID=A0A348B0F8_9CREN|nr:NDP-sugar synthase [Sulfodiicoccus acidiphilus]BBD71660.1 nucleotidyltransferase [Sulfodiicoccus acidiphilus]GGT86788.1 nucleotidyltransferase [Sulfodiicoccus acidiphilus]